MTKIEFTEFFDAELRGRWPKWDPTTYVVDDWYRLFRYHSLATATEAVQEHRVSEKANVFEPQINLVAKWLRDHASQRRLRSWGPCFVTVRNDGARFPHHIESIDEPTQGQIRATAEATALRWTNAYLRPFHWEPADATDEPMVGPLRGQSALAEAKRIIRDEPGDSAGKRFLLDGQRLAERMGVPPEPPRDEYASQTMLDRLQQPQPAPGGPSPEFDLSMNPEDD